MNTTITEQANAQVGPAYIDGARVLATPVSPDGRTVLAWCGHRVNEHRNLEGGRKANCRICHDVDWEPGMPADYYVRPVWVPEAYRLFRSGSRSPYNQWATDDRPAAVSVKRLWDWRARQEATAALAARGPSARSPRHGGDVPYGLEGLYPWDPWARLPWPVDHDVNGFRVQREHATGDPRWTSDQFRVNDGEEIVWLAPLGGWNCTGPRCRRGCKHISAAQEYWRRKLVAR